MTTKILVTGGAGYIGSHVCKALAGKGYEPITYDNLSRGNRWAVKWGPLEVGDLNDRARIFNVLNRYQPAAVVHLAGYTYVDESLEKPELYYSNNVGGTASLLSAIANCKPIPIVFSSTCAVYGIPERIPISEDDPQRPTNPYGFSKLIVEKMLADFDRAHKSRWISLRYFNAAGADPDGEIGELHDPESHLIPRVLAAARDGTTVSVYGNDYATPDGTCIRDYIHVMDLADAHIRALDDLLGGGASGALNLANARGHSVMEVVETTKRVCRVPIRIEIAPRRHGDMPVLIGAANRAHSRLGWRPERSELEIQIADAWRWMMQSRQRKTV